MKVYNTLGLREKCSIAGKDDGLPFKIARPSTSKVLDGEILHYHPMGHEMYLVIEGGLVLRVGDNLVNATKGQLVVVEPGESHKVEKIIGAADYLVFNTNPDPLDKIVLE